MPEVDGKLVLPTSFVISAKEEGADLDKARPPLKMLCFETVIAKSIVSSEIVALSFESEEVYTTHCLHTDRSTSIPARTHRTAITAILRDQQSIYTTSFRLQRHGTCRSCNSTSHKRQRVCRRAPGSSSTCSATQRHSQTLRLWHEDRCNACPIFRKSPQD